MLLPHGPRGYVQDVHVHAAERQAGVAHDFDTHYTRRLGAPYPARTSALTVRAPAGARVML